MPRKARITVAGAVHHVMSRGIEGCEIFRSDDDRHFFKSLLEKNLAKSGYLLYAWCFMSNHYHLILRCNEYPLSRFMRLVNGPYAQYFRKGREVRGYLFQDRYKSIVTEDQFYIEELVRYVHLNPVRAGIFDSIEKLRGYPWCGHGVLMGIRKWDFQNTRDVLNRFGDTVNESRKKYERFLREGMLESPDLFSLIRDSNSGVEDMHSSNCWVIGNKEFIVRAMAENKKNLEQMAKHARAGISIEKVAAELCQKAGVSIESVGRRSRNSLESKLRKIIAFIANRRYGIPVCVIAKFFNITSASVSNMIGAGERGARELKLN